MFLLYIYQSLPFLFAEEISIIKKLKEKALCSDTLFSVYYSIYPYLGISEMKYETVSKSILIIVMDWDWVVLMVIVRIVKPKRHHIETN